MEKSFINIEETFLAESCFPCKILINKLRIPDIEDSEFRLLQRLVENCKTSIENNFEAVITRLCYRRLCQNLRITSYVFWAIFT